MDPPPAVQHTQVQKHCRRVNQAGAADAPGSTAANDAEANLTVLQPHMVDGSGCGPHAAADIGPFQGRSGGGGAGDHTVPIAQYHFAVGSDIHQQGHFRPFVKPGGQDAAQSVRTHIAGDIRYHQDPCRRAAGQDITAWQHLRPGQDRGEGHRCQIVRGNSQKKLLHGRISHHGNHPHSSGGHLCLAADLP